MPKYEYEIINRDQAERVEWVGDLFNEMGSYGWKLCVVSDWFFGFEREIVEEVPLNEAIDQAWIKIDNAIHDKHGDD